MIEIFKKIPSNSGYEVSNFGRVKSLRRSVRNGYGKKVLPEMILKGDVNKYGYNVVSLSKNSIHKKITVHQLVAIAFLGHKPNGMELVINHKDFNKLNNHVDNLEIVTCRENSSKTQVKPLSKYIGVTKNGKKWRARIFINNADVYLGTFKTEVRASIAYQLALFQLDKINKL